MDSKVTQAQLLLEVFRLVTEKKVCPENTAKDWVKVLLYLHSKGWLYVGFENKKIVIATALYRIKDIKDIGILPKEEEGNILFVPFFASKAKDVILAKRLLTNYLAKHKNIEKIAFEIRKDNKDDLRIYTRKEFKNEQVKDPKPAGDTNIL